MTKQNTPDGESFRRMITVWISQETVQKAQELAWKQHRTRTRVLSEILEEHVARQYEQEMEKRPSDSKGKQDK